MEFTLLALMVALGWKVVDTFKYAEKKDWKSVRTQVVAWVSGVAMMFLASASNWASQQEVNGQLLSDLNWVSKVLAGMALLSVASVVKDVVSPIRHVNQPKGNEG